jgi:hypothetical protein
MAYNEVLAQRVREFFEGRRIHYETKPMMGGLCFMVKGKMCVGVEKDRLMARIGPDAYVDALSRRGCRPMDFTGRPMRGFVFVERDALKSDKELASWLELALVYNSIAKKSGRKRAKTAA